MSADATYGGKSQGAATSAAAPDTDAASGTILAIRSAFKLGASLLGTWGIALVVRFLLPRHLGPERFGSLSFADAFTVAAFVTLNLGTDAYIRKEVAVRSSHASDFFGGLLVIRVAMSSLILAGLWWVIRRTGRSLEVEHAVLLFGVAQFFVTLNATLSAMLHAVGRVGRMSVLAVVTKLVWAGGSVFAMLTGGRLWEYAASLLASEAIETVVLYALARDQLGLVFRVELVATRRMLARSLPYYVMLFATTAYGKLDVSLLEFLADRREVGWYGAASAIGSLTLMIAPLMGWVLMPMFARAAARSRDELSSQTRRSLELILSVAIPASMLLNLGAPVWIRFLFGEPFAPGAPALRLLSAVFVVTYVAIVYAQTLIMLERAWTLAWISIGGLIVNVGLNLWGIRPLLRALGPGGGGTACALALLGTELFVTTCMIVTVGRLAFDGRSARTLAKSLGACATAAVIHMLLAPLGPFRLIADAAVYAAVVLATGAVPLRDMTQAVRDAVRSKTVAS